MTKQRSVVEVIDEMLAVIPADQDEFIGALEILVQSINASSKQKNLRKGKDRNNLLHRGTGRDSSGKDGFHGD